MLCTGGGGGDTHAGEGTHVSAEASHARFTMGSIGNGPVMVMGSIKLAMLASCCREAAF